MWPVFRRNREGLYLVLAMPSTGADNTDIKIDEKMQKVLFVYFYLKYPLSLDYKKPKFILSLIRNTQIKVCYVMH